MEYELFELPLRRVDFLQRNLDCSFIFTARACLRLARYFDRWLDEREHRAQRRPELAGRESDLQPQLAFQFLDSFLSQGEFYLILRARRANNSVVKATYLISVNVEWRVG